MVGNPKGRLGVPSPKLQSQSSIRHWWTSFLPLRLLDSGAIPGSATVRVALQQSLVSGDDLVDQVASLRIRPRLALGVLRKRLWQFGVERAADLFRRRGVTVASLSWAGGFTGSLGFQFQEAVDDARTAIAEAQAIGARTLIVAPGGQSGYTVRHARRLALDGIRRLVEAATEEQVELAVLADLGVRGSTRSLLQTWEDAASFLHEVNSSQVKLACPLAGLHRVSERWRSWEQAAAKISIVATAAGLDPSPLAIAETSAALSRLVNCGFQGTWEFVSDAKTAPWWNGREAMLHCCPWADAVLRRLPRLRGLWSGGGADHR